MMTGRTPQVARSRWKRLAMCCLAVAAVATGDVRAAQGDNKAASMQMRSITKAQREAARLRQAKQKTGVSATYAGLSSATLAYSPLAATASGALAAMAAPLSTPDYFGVPNWAN